MKEKQIQSTLLQLKLYIKHRLIMYYDIKKSRLIICYDNTKNRLTICYDIIKVA